MDSPRSKCIPNMKNLTVYVILHTFYTKYFAHMFCQRMTSWYWIHINTCVCMCLWVHSFICLSVFWAIILSYSYSEIAFTNFHVKNEHVSYSLLLINSKHSKRNTYRKDYGMVRHWKRKSALKTLILKKKKILILTT